MCNRYLYLSMTRNNAWHSSTPLHNRQPMGTDRRVVEKTFLQEDKGHDLTGVTLIFKLARKTSPTGWFLPSWILYRSRYCGRPVTSRIINNALKNQKIEQLMTTVAVQAQTHNHCTHMPNNNSHVSHLTDNNNTHSNIHCKGLVPFSFGP